MWWRHICTQINEILTFICCHSNPRSFSPWRGFSLWSRSSCRSSGLRCPTWARVPSPAFRRRSASSRYQPPAVTSEEQRDGFVFARRGSDALCFLAVHGPMVWNRQTPSSVREGTLHRNQLHSDDGELHSRGQLGNTVSSVCDLRLLFTTHLFSYAHVFFDCRTTESTEVFDYCLSTGLDTVCFISSHSSHVLYFTFKCFFSSYIFCCNMIMSLTWLSRRALRAQTSARQHFIYIKIPRPRNHLEIHWCHC